MQRLLLFCPNKQLVGAIEVEIEKHKKVHDSDNPKDLTDEYIKEIKKMENEAGSLYNGKIIYTYFQFIFC